MSGFPATHLLKAEQAASPDYDVRVGTSAGVMYTIYKAAGLFIAEPASDLDPVIFPFVSNPDFRTVLATVASLMTGGGIISFREGSIAYGNVADAVVTFTSRITLLANAGSPLNTPVKWQGGGGIFVVVCAIGVSFGGDVSIIGNNETKFIGCSFSGNVTVDCISTLDANYNGFIGCNFLTAKMVTITATQAGHSTNATVFLGCIYATGETIVLAINGGLDVAETRFDDCYYTQNGATPIFTLTTCHDVYISLSHFENTAGATIFTIPAGAGTALYLDNCTFNNPLTNVWGNNIVAGQIITTNSKGMSRVGNLITPFDNTGHIIGMCAGNVPAALPTALATDYDVVGTDVYIVDTTPNGGTITLKDPAGATIITGWNSTTTPLFVPMGCKLNFVAALPTAFKVVVV